MRPADGRLTCTGERGKSKVTGGNQIWRAVTAISTDFIESELAGHDRRSEWMHGARVLRLCGLMHAGAPGMNTWIKSRVAALPESMRTENWRVFKLIAITRLSYIHARTVVPGRNNWQLLERADVASVTRKHVRDTKDACRRLAFKWI